MGNAPDAAAGGAGGGVRAEPPALYFSGIAPGVPLAANLRLINAAGEPVRMHINPPSTPFFSMAVQKRGRVMPGMAEEVTVTFSGDELRYFTDAIRVHLPGGQNLRVPLHAFPAVSPLSFPRRVDFGKVQLGAVARKALPLRSAVPVEFEFAVQMLASAPDVTVEPLSGVVPANGECSIVLRYTPSRFATAAARFRLSLSSLAFEPIEVEVVGSALGPTEVRKEHLNELLAQREADLAARAAAEKPSSPDAIAQARAPRASPRAASHPSPGPSTPRPLPSRPLNPHPPPPRSPLTTSSRRRRPPAAPPRSSSPRRLRRWSAPAPPPSAARPARATR